MPASALQTKSWYRPNGWLTNHEEKVVVNRVLRDDSAKGDLSNRPPVSPKELLYATFDFDLLPIYLVRLVNDIGSSLVSTYLILTLRKLEFSPFDTNLLTIPYNVIMIITMLGMGYISETINSRALLMSVIPVWIFGLFAPITLLERLRG